MPKILKKEKYFQTHFKRQALPLWIREYYKRKKCQANILSEHRYKKNSQQNNSKQNSTTP
jgi:hypothetical protein